jgi:hypothetical protein
MHERSFSVGWRWVFSNLVRWRQHIVVRDVYLVTWPGRCAIVRFVAETMIAVDGGAVWADDSGGGGRPVVLLHPGVGDSRIWEPVLPALAGSWRVIRYDARGFGRSPAPAARFCLLADLITVLDHFGLARVAVVGCSQGGGSALGLALEHPARVSALVLLCPGVPGYRWPEEPGDERDAGYGRALAAGDVEALAGLPGMDHLPPLREPDLVLRIITSTLAGASW